MASTKINNTQLTIDATPTNGSTNTVQSDGVFDALATKQDTLVSGTSIKTFNGASLLASGDIYLPDVDISGIQALGSVILAQTLFTNPAAISGNVNLADAQVVFVAMYLRKAATITGVKWWQSTGGNYTADQYNGVAIHTYSAGNITKQVESTNDGNIWKGSNNTVQSKAFSSTYAASAGIHIVSLLYNSSAQTTAPALGKVSGFTNSALSSLDLTNSAKIISTLSAQTAIPAGPTAMSSLTVSGNCFWVAIY